MCEHGYDVCIGIPEGDDWDCAHWSVETTDGDQVFFRNVMNGVFILVCIDGRWVFECKR